MDYMPFNTRTHTNTIITGLIVMQRQQLWRNAYALSSDRDRQRAAKELVVRHIPIDRAKKHAHVLARNGTKHGRLPAHITHVRLAWRPAVCPTEQLTVMCRARS